MDIYEKWEAHVDRCKPYGELRDLYKLKRALATFDNAGEVLSLLVKEVLDTDDVAYIIKMLGEFLDVDIDLLSMITPEGHRVTMQAVEDE